MYKTKKKSLLIMVLIGTMLLSSLSVQAQPVTSPTDKVIEAAYEDIVNIKNQLAIMLQNYFVYLSNQTVDKPTNINLPIYENQLNEISKTLEEAITLQLEQAQAAKVQVLTTTILYLRSIIRDTESLLEEMKAEDQYRLFRTIIYTNMLADQILAYFD